MNTLSKINTLSNMTAQQQYNLVYRVIRVINTMQLDKVERIQFISTTKRNYLDHGITVEIWNNAMRTSHNV